MKKRILKVLGGTVVVIAALALILVAVILVRADRRFDAPYPNVRATNDPALIARGEYIAHGPGHCINCHTLNSESPSIAKGATPPLAGGHVFDLPFGKVYTPNLTPDKETGIGRRSDAEPARVLRYGVHADGRAVLPFMEYHDLSDEDLSALLSFLRAQKPVRREVPKHELTLIGKAVMAFAIEPIGPKSTPLQFSPRPNRPSSAASTSPPPSPSAPSATPSATCSTAATCRPASPAAWCSRPTPTRSSSAPT